MELQIEDSFLQDNDILPKGEKQLTKDSLKRKKKKKRRNKKRGHGVQNFNNPPYYMASSVSGQDESNPAL